MNEDHFFNDPDKQLLVDAIVFRVRQHLLKPWMIAIARQMASIALGK